MAHDVVKKMYFYLEPFLIAYIFPVVKKSKKQLKKAALKQEIPSETESN